MTAGLSGSDVETDALLSTSSLDKKMHGGTWASETPEDATCSRDEGCDPFG